jgi:thiamine kinase-like enzyme
LNAASSLAKPIFLSCNLKHSKVDLSSSCDRIDQNFNPKSNKPIEPRKEKKKISRTKTNSSPEISDEVAVAWMFFVSGLHSLMLLPFLPALYKNKAKEKELPHKNQLKTKNSNFRLEDYTNNCKFGHCETEEMKSRQLINSCFELQVFLGKIFQ